MNPTVASITKRTSLLVPQFYRLRVQNMIPTFIMDKLDRIPHSEGNNDGGQEYSQWQRWANNGSHRSRQRRHIDPRLIKSSDDLLSEYVDPQAEQHMSFPEPRSFVPTKRKSAPGVQAAPKAIPVNSHLYPKPDIHDYEDDEDVADLVSLFSSHDPYSSSSASMSLATTILTEDEGEEEKVQEPFEMDASQFFKYSSRRHQNDYRHDYNISSVPRKNTRNGSGSGLGQDLRMTMNDSSLSHLTTLLQAKSSLIRQQEAIMRDIEERQVAEQQQHQQEQQHQQRRDQQQREALSSAATAQSALAVDAGFLIPKPDTTGTSPLQDPFTIVNMQAATATSTASSNSTGRQVAAPSGDTGNWWDALRRRRVRVVDETPKHVQRQQQQYQF
jgi:hypothetical protein